MKKLRPYYVKPAKTFFYWGWTIPKEHYDDIKKHIQNGEEPLEKTKNIYMVSYMIFRTGSVLIVGKCTENILNYIYNFIKTILYEEFINIECLTPKIIKRETIKKIKKKSIQVST